MSCQRDPFLHVLRARKFISAGKATRLVGCRSWFGGVRIATKNVSLPQT